MEFEVLGKLQRCNVQEIFTITKNSLQDLQQQSPTLLSTINKPQLCCQQPRNLIVLHYSLETIISKP
jgi:hypothetical protein